MKTIKQKVIITSLEGELLCPYASFFLCKKFMVSYYLDNFGGL